MAVQYNRPFKMMIDRKMTPTELRDHKTFEAESIGGKPNGCAV